MRHLPFCTLAVCTLYSRANAQCKYIGFWIHSCYTRTRVMAQDVHWSTRDEMGNKCMSINPLPYEVELRAQLRQDGGS